MVCTEGSFIGHLPIHGHDHSRSAVPTLGAVEVGDTFLNRVETFLVVSDTFNSRDLPAVHTQQGTQTLGKRAL